MELSTMPPPRPAVVSGIVTAMETPQSAVGHLFSLVSSNNPTSLFESQLGPVSSRF